jgi:general secretion pathway protein D
VAIFDVDWMQGMSVGIFPVQNTEAKTLSAELDKLFAAQLQGGVAADMIRLVPMDRLNAVLAVTPQPAYLDQVKAWVERLDVVSRGSGMRLFVYRVKNRKAAELAVVLNSVFGGTQQTISRPALAPLSLAPGLTPTEIKSSPAGQSQPSVLGKAAKAAVGSINFGPTSGEGEELAFAEGGGIRVIADEVNNALIVMTTAQGYRLVEEALRKMDIMPRQVLVEASIIEVNLKDELRFGLQWFFKTSGGRMGVSGKAVLSSGTSDILGVGPFPAFSYSIVDSAGQITAVLNTLASESKIDVLSNPTLVVLDNQTANIKVGDQVPIRTSESTSTATSGIAPVITSTIEFRDTGVMLGVKPQVNPGGLVTLQITQEVNDVKQTTSSGIDSPTITQRMINTVVAIQSGETVILGGLIKENKNKSNSGVPGLKDIPILGALFGETHKSVDRTELVVLITPRVINSPEDARNLAEDFRSKMKGLQPTKNFKSEKPGQATP